MIVTIKLYGLCLTVMPSGGSKDVQQQSEVLSKYFSVWMLGLRFFEMA